MLICRHSVAKPGAAEKVQAAIDDLPGGSCMGITYASKIDSTLPWITHGAPGSCSKEVETTLRQLYDQCSQITNKVRDSAPVVQPVQAAPVATALCSQVPVVIMSPVSFIAISHHDLQKWCVYA